MLRSQTILKIRTRTLNPALNRQFPDLASVPGFLLSPRTNALAWGAVGFNKSRPADHGESANWRIRTLLERQNQYIYIPKLFLI